MTSYALLTACGNSIKWLRSVFSQDFFIDTLVRWQNLRISKLSYKCLSKTPKLFDFRGAAPFSHADRISPRHFFRSVVWLCKSLSILLLFHSTGLLARQWTPKSRNVFCADAASTEVNEIKKGEKGGYNIQALTALAVASKGDEALVFMPGLQPVQEAFRRKTHNVARWNRRGIPYFVFLPSVLKKRKGHTLYRLCHGQ